ncbi:undecaprenyldiphospho-muramoylpentapeptide beta-N-acetylglucosaminyltransferase [Saprospira sp. CCB-QB6]|uniref:undecaprenyldiphospho-muramoylpentapeptide beta-N-acetylglucosaminyltransferase n=1 Tax=Saprospira sp. CCB-QB6 TaxID=3023936 RepID=UPI00234A7753|nr:undecaprenyldiphospho-muramoylpentapeptide beta-N-acetylglucosaminyltransferase [Saprospira sp. CCB-QB6]WCL82089.1 undecaprenyldiphospho-muramoylpentapeptide beta-N-acetylglucosaminyltransferase [Saprospira sp. CCB-QB6]
MKYLISGGGTGGHIFPAIAIAQALEQADPEAEFLFVGAEGKMEMQKVPEAGYRIEGLPIAGFNRQNLLKNWKLPFKIWASMSKARKLIRDFQPDAAIGVGGYASGVAVKMANMMKIPTLVHEQNSYAGKTNQILGKTVDKVCVAYPNMQRFFPANKIVQTGNPIRKDLLQKSDKRAEAFAFYGFEPNKKTIFLTGGSLGARSLNESVLPFVEELQKQEVQVLWQAGKLYIKEFEPLAQKYPNLKIQAFIQRMDLAYAMADMVIARAGALTLSELCENGKAAILVPSPNVAEDHQTANAKALTEQGAALWLPDAEARKKLIPQALELLQNETEIQKLGQAAKSLAKPQAAQEIAQEVLKLIK